MTTCDRQHANGAVFLVGSSIYWLRNPVAMIGDADRIRQDCGYGKQLLVERQSARGRLAVIQIVHHLRTACVAARLLECTTRVWVFKHQLMKLVRDDVRPFHFLPGTLTYFVVQCRHVGDSPGHASLFDAC